MNPELPEGVFRFRIREISYEENALTAYGMSERLTIHFRVKTDEGWQNYRKNLYPSKNVNSQYRKFMNMVAEAYGKPRFDVGELVNAKGKFEIIHEEKDGHVLTLVENLQREDMNCFEVAEGIRQLMADYELTQCEAAQQLGFSQSAVANKLRLLRLPEEERRQLLSAGLGERHARALLRLENRDVRRHALERMVEGKLTVAQAERLVEELLAGRTRRRPAKPLVRDVRVFFNTVNHALDIMRRGGIPAESTRREEEDYIEYVVRIPKQAAARRGT